jgi:RnfABCDGE-type electron transport complex B subunit
MLTAASILLAAAVLVVLAIVMAYILGWANRAFHVDIDPAVAEIIDALPGANCGGCGYVGCSEYAEAVADGKAPVTLCAPGGNTCSSALAAIMGVDAAPAVKQLAVIHCSATANERLLLSAYDGEATCAAANLVSAVQGCAHGCLGLGDCANACPCGAIRIVNSLAVVDETKCVGCGKCVAACPRNIISMVPFDTGRTLVVACSNPDFGADVKHVCSTGCIGCKACAKMCDAIEMKGNLPVIDYERLTDGADAESPGFEAIVAKCPTNSLAVIRLAAPASRLVNNPG